MVAGDVAKFTGNAGYFSESVQESTGSLHLIQNRKRWMQFAKCGKVLYRWSQVPRGPMCIRHGWDGCRCCLEVVASNGSV